MNGAVFTVLISGALSVLAALGTVALTHYFGRMRDREAVKLLGLNRPLECLLTQQMIHSV